MLVQGTNADMFRGGFKDVSPRHVVLLKGGVEIRSTIAAPHYATKIMELAGE